MKKIILKTTVLLSVFLLTGQLAFPQTAELDASFSLPEKALMDIEPEGSNINFSIDLASTEAGDSPEIQEAYTNDELWVNYSSSLPISGNARSVTAEIALGALPEGFSLFIQASAYTGTGGGQHGQTAGKVEISGQPNTIITGIGNCFTGDGTGNGHLLTFSLEITNFSEVSSLENSSVVVSYTITDN